MKTHCMSRPFRPVRSKSWWLTMSAVSAMALTVAMPARAQDASGLEELQATTLALIDTLVDSGILSREKADRMLAAAKARAQVQVAAQQATRPPELGKDGKKVVRVPYVPESVKAEMREQIKQEVLLQARNERWGEPGALPAWMARFAFQGDLRLRQEFIRLDSANTPSGILSNPDLTRAVDMFNPGSRSSAGVVRPPFFNTQDDYDRQRVRARLAVTAQVSDEVVAGLRLTTGNTNDRTSTNQTLGQNFNKYTVVLDQAYLSIKPWKDTLELRGGRFANPFMATDLVWADDLGFEGVAARGKYAFSPAQGAFFNAGWFPITSGNPGTSRSRSLLGLQGGLEGKLGRDDSRYRLGLALYDFRGLAGRRESDDDFNAGVSDYVTRSEYASGLRQRGNTLFRLNAPADVNASNYGLASEFRELNLTAVVEFDKALPVPLTFTVDYVKNLQFKRSDIRSRTGLDISDGDDTGFMVKAQIGKNQMLRRHDWNASLAYRRLGSDAVLDAFTNSDFGLGGTNNKGFVLQGNYGIYDNTWLSMRVMSSDLIDSFVPGSKPSTRLSVDTLQIDLNTKF